MTIEAKETYFREILLHVLQAPWAEKGALKAPDMPDILKERS